MLKIIVAGIAGRMGREIAQGVDEREGMRLVGGFERKNHPSVGKNLSGCTISSDLKKIIELGDVVIDFTSPSAALEHFNIAVDYGKPMVIGATGFSKEELSAIKSRCGKIGCVMAPNMSVGVNVMFKLAEEAAKTLGSAYDMEIVEIHHRLKKDSPSGTAQKLAEICAESTNRDLEKVGVYGRHGMVGERKPDEIAVMSLRAGDVTGDHTLIFAGPGERLEITHRAGSRKNFAVGAIRAAEWIVGQKSGLYDMRNVLSL